MIIPLSGKVDCTSTSAACQIVWCWISINTAGFWLCFYCILCCCHVDDGTRVSDLMWPWSAVFDVCSSSIWVPVEFSTALTVFSRHKRMLNVLSTFFVIRWRSCLPDWLMLNFNEYFSVFAFLPYSVAAVLTTAPVPLAWRALDEQLAMEVNFFFWGPFSSHSWDQSRDVPSTSVGNQSCFQLLPRSWPLSYDIHNV